jgi:hypothetical protein
MIYTIFSFKMVDLKRYILAFVIILTAMAGLSQQVNVSASLDTNAMLVGDHVGLKLKLTGPANVKVQWPVIPDTILGNITVIGRGNIDSSFSADRNQLTLSQDLNLTCFDSGFYTIPQIPFYYNLPPDTTEERASADLLMLAVHTIKVDTTQAIKPIIGPEKVPLTFREMVPYILAGLLAAFIIAGIVWYLRKRRKNQPVLQFIPKVSIPPHEMALQRLETLRGKKLWQSGKIKEYYTELTEIVRNYIEVRYKVPALEQTSSEILDALSVSADFPGSLKPRLQIVLERADMVKFAKALPVATENEDSMQEAVSFITKSAFGSSTPKEFENIQELNDGRPSNG